MNGSQHPNTYQPLLFAPSELLACGLHDAHHHPLVGERTAGGGVRSWRTSPEKAWEHPLVEWPRTANSYCSVVLDCDSRESQELALDVIEVGSLDLPRPNIAALRSVSGHVQLGWNLRTPVHRGSRRGSGHSRPSDVSRSTTRPRSGQTGAMLASWPTTLSTTITRPSIRALNPSTWGNWRSLFPATGEGPRSRRTWQPHRAATATCSRRCASWRSDAPMTAC